MDYIALCGRCDLAVTRSEKESVCLRMGQT